MRLLLIAFAFFTAVRCTHAPKHVAKSDTIFLAASRNDVTALKPYLSDKAVMNQTGEKTGTNALMVAAFRGSADAVKALISAGADIQHRDFDRLTALHYASQSRNPETVRLLLQAGADPNIKQKDGLTPLIFAVRIAPPDTVRVLIEGGANVNLTDETGWPPLFHAIPRGRNEVLDLLIDAGADLKYQDPNERFSALHIAALYREKNACNHLLKRKAPAGLKDKNGRLYKELPDGATCG